MYNVDEEKTNNEANLNQKIRKLKMKIEKK